MIEKGARKMVPEVWQQINEELMDRVLPIISGLAEKYISLIKTS
jgi:hypothetical protein